MISERNFLILQYCAVTPSSPKMLADGLGVTRHTAQNAMWRLYERDMMIVDDGMYTTSTEGRIEIRRYKEAQSRIAPSAKINKFEGIYVPTVGYQRNNGFAHIPSRGFPC
jgi:hypothetical protein